MSYVPEVETGLLFVGLACPSQAYSLPSLPVPVIQFARPGLPACRFLQPAWQGLSGFVSQYYDDNRLKISVKQYRK